MQVHTMMDISKANPMLSISCQGLF